MRNFNFLSKSSSQSCGHSSVTLAMTVGSPSVHRRGAMLKPLFLAMLFLIAGVGNVLGGKYTINYGDSFSPALPTASGSVNSTSTAHTVSGLAIKEQGIYKGSSNNYLMFVSGKGFLYNTSNLVTVTSVAATYSSGTSTTGKTGVYFGTSEKSTYTTSSNATIKGQSKTDTWTNSTAGNGYFQLSTSNKNVQITQIVITCWTKVTLDKNGGTADGVVYFDDNAAAASTATGYTFSAASRTGSYTCTGYYTAASGGTKVLNANGTFANANVSGYITSSKWTYAGATLKLYAQWEAAAVETPTINPSVSELDWGTVNKGASLNTKTFTITGSNLTAANLVYSANGGYSVSPTGKDGAAGALASQTITVTPPSTATPGTYNSTVSISGGGLASPVSVAVKLTVQDVDYFIDEVQSTTGYTGDGMAKAGDYSASLPSIADKSVATTGNCQALHYHFCGWVTEEFKDNPNGHLATINGTATGTTYYAVWAKQGTGGGDFDGEHEGDYYIYANISGTKYYATGFASKMDKSTNISDAALFTFEKVVEDNKTYFAIKSENYYLGWSSSTNFTTTNTSAYKWIPNEGSYGTWRLKASGDNNRSIVYRAGSTNKFAPYSCSNINGTEYYDIEIGGAVTYTDSITVCCSPLGSINGSISLSQSGNDLVANEWNATTGSNETGYLVKLYNSTKSAVIASGNTEGTAKTYTFTNPGAGTYWVSVTPTFSGDGNFCEAGEETFSASSITLTGKVVVTFKLNDGTVEGGVEKTQEVTANEATPLTSIATLGYIAPSCKEFGGWAASEEDANAATPVVFKADEATINVSEATNLWAIWNTKTFAVTDGTIDASVASHSFSNTVACGSDLTITCAAAAAYKGNPTVTATGVHGEITVNSATSVTIANVQSAIAVSIAYPTPKEIYVITWNVNGSALSGAALAGTTTSVYEGGAIENLPADPSGLTCKNTFKGWSTKDSKTIPQTTAYYDDLFTAASGAPAISKATTFYAVFGSASAQSTNLFSWDGGASAGLTAEGNHVTASGLGSDYADSNAPYLVKLDGTGDYIIIDVASRPAKVAIDVKMIGGSNTSSITIQEAASKDALTFTDVETLSISGSQNDVVNLETTNPFAATTRAIKLLFTKGSNVGVGPISITGVEVPDYVTECAAVEAPTFDVAAGTYNEAQSVSMDCATDGATIKYTTDGTEPSKTVGTAYTEAIAVNQSMTIKAIAIKGEDASEVVSAAYELKVATPAISGATAFVNTSEVTITCAGATIYYTLDGSDPTNESAQYTAPFTVDATTTVKAIAVKANWTNSEIASQTFTKVTPLTVATALTNIDALSNNGTIADQYVKGLISEINSYNNGTITYYISDDGTTSSQLQVYRGSAGVANGGNAFTSADDLKVGEEVVVFGTLKKYKSGNNPVIPEFVNPNEIVAYRPFSPIAWSANAYTAELGSSNSFPTLSGTDGLTISYSSSDETVATISADGTTYDLKKVGSTTITATSEANASYVATTKSYTLTVAPTVIRVDLDIECNSATSGCPATTHMTKQTNLPDPLPAVAKAGKNFGGWYTDYTFETPAVAGAALTENTTIYAQWLEPYTVAQALTMIAALGNNESTENVYVAGVVTDDAVSVSSNTATYKIKDAGEDNELKVYKGKGLANANVTEASQIQEGDELVIYGPLYKFYSSGNTTPEINQGNYIYSQVRPTVDVTGVTVASTANVRAGKTVTLTAEIAPANATNKNVTWSVKSGDTYAEVSAAGVVTGLAEGTAVIEVETEDGGFKAQCTVTVAAGLPTFTEDDHEWIKITTASKLVAGRFYVIGESSKGVTATNVLSSNYLAKVATTITDGVIASGSLGTNTAIFELGGNSTDGWMLYELTDEENTGYLSGTDASDLSWSASAATTSISFDESGNAILGNANGYRVLYNSNSPRFKGYSSDLSTAMLLPQLYMWAELSHSVTFDANGGVAESVPGVERTDEGKIIIPATEPTHSDISKAFAGWYKSDAPATLYNAGDEFETNVDVTLYAKWNSVPTYTVTYVPGGAGTVPAVASYREGQKVQVEEASLSNPGYSFAGWTVKDAEQNVLPLDEENKFDMPASNVTITAVWSRISNQKWTLVKQGETLEIDAEYVIAYNSNTVKKALGAISSNIGTPVDVTIDGEILKGSDAMKVLTLKAGNGVGNYAFQSGSKYLTYSGSGNTLNESEDPNDASSWTIAIDENNVATISNVDASTRKLQYNTGSPRFACYTGSQKDVQLYKKAASVVINGEQTVNAADITANADVTIKNGGTLNVNADKQIGDLTVENGGKVTLNNKLTVVGTFTIETTMASGNSGQLSGATASNFEAGEAYIDITLGAGGTNQQWHAFTVPFPVDAMNGIYDLDGNKLTNEVNYAIMDYHGDIRAQGQYGWKKYRGVLVPGTFYIMATDGYRTTYRFKKKAGEALVADNSKDIFEYAASGDGQTTDAGWNGIGNPNLFYGKVNLAVQVLDPMSYTFVTKTAQSTNFVVGTPFFYQATANGSMVMETANAGGNYAPARERAIEIKDVPVSFGNEDFNDYLYVTANEDALNTYETGKDLAKMTMTNTPKVAQIFGKAYNTKLCMVHAPMVNNQAEVALELYAPQAGIYTISVPAEREDASLYLTKNGNIIWDLTMSPYEAEFDKGQNNGYGLMLVRKAPQVTTGVENVQGDKIQCTKVILNDHVYILRDAQLYDVTGKAVK